MFILCSNPTVSVSKLPVSFVLHLQTLQAAHAIGSPNDSYATPTDLCEFFVVGRLIGASISVAWRMCT